MKNEILDRLALLSLLDGTFMAGRCQSIQNVRLTYWNSHHEHTNYYIPEKSERTSNKSR